MCDFIKLSRKITEWEWYKCSNTKSLFIHLLLHANWKDGRFKGYEVKRGQLVTGRKQLAEDTGLTERQIRTCLKHLKLTGEIEQKTTSKFSIITICNYEKYQAKDFLSDQQVTSKRPASDQQVTTIEERKNKKNNNTYSLEGFDDFYFIYPRKEKKEDARRAWDKLRPDDEMRALITSSLEKQLPKFSQTERRYIPLPASWINGKRWEDEIAPEQIGTNSQTGREVSEWI